jgi:hypothetical protein
MKREWSEKVPIPHPSGKLIYARVRDDGKRIRLVHLVGRGSAQRMASHSG